MNDTLPNPTQELPTINFANAVLLPSDDGKAAIATFTIMGAFNVSIVFPAVVVDEFIAHWIRSKQQALSIAQLAARIQRSKV